MTLRRSSLLRARPFRILATAATAAAAFALSACGDASIGSPRGLSYGPGGGGGGTGHPSPGGGADNGGTTGGGGGSGGSTGGGGTTVDAGGGGTGTGGGGGGTDAGTTVTASYKVAVDKATVASDLLSSVELMVTIDPAGFKGSVALSASGLPTDVTATFASATMNLDGTTPMTSKVTLSTLTSTKPGDAPFAIVATSSAGTQSAKSTLTVNSVLTIKIPQGVIGLGGTTGNPYKTAFGTYPIMIAAPTGISSQTPVTVKFYNADNTSHEIHASSPGAGFPHDGGPISAMSMDNTVRKVNTKGTYDFYLHDQGGAATVGRVVIQ